jgi:hypothetical protein
MKNTILLVIAFFTITCLKAQTTATEKETAIVAVIHKFFEHFHQGDSSQLRAMFHTTAKLQAIKYKNGKAELSEESLKGLLQAVAQFPKDKKIQEKLLDYKVQIDADLATVWTPYKFYINDVFSHCGANAFTLVKVDETWLILNIIDTRRKEKCE